METAPPTPPQAPSPLPDARVMALLASLIVFGLFVTLGASIQLLNVAFGIWFTEVLIFFAVGWIALRRGGREPVRYTGLGAPSVGPAVFGFLVSVANYFAFVVPIQYTAQRVLPERWQRLFDATKLFEGQTPLELALIVAGVSVAAPVCEEFFFRGFLQKGLMRQGTSSTHAIALTAVIFSAFHLDPIGFLARVELGVLFGWLFVRTGSLWPSILAHSANNLVSTVAYFATKGSQAPPESDLRAEIQAIVLLSAMGCMALWGLMSATRSFPTLLGRPPGDMPPDAVALPTPPLGRLVLPWVLAAVISVAGLAAVDARGIQLSLFDARHELPYLPRDAADALHAERKALYELRARARRGEVPLGAYQEERVRQAAKPSPEP